MGIFTLLRAYQLRQISSFFKRQRVAKLITIALFLLTLGGVGLAIYFFCLAGFKYVRLDGDFANVAGYYTFHLFSLILLVLGFFSSVIVTLFSLFRNPKDEWFVVSPSFQSLYLLRVWQVIVSALWPFLILFLPLFAAFVRVVGVTWYDAFFLLVGALLSTAFSALLAVLFTLSVGRIYIYFQQLFSQPLRFEHYTRLLLIILIILVGAGWYWLRSMHLLALFSQIGGDQVKSLISSIESAFAFLPSTPLAKILYGMWSGDDTRFINGLISVFILSLLVGLGTLWAGSWYFSLWQQLQEGRSSKNKAQNVWLAGVLEKAKNPVEAFFLRELVTLFRQGKNTMWLLFLFLIWLLQVTLLSGIGRRGEVIQTSTIAWLLPLQIGFTLYFMSTFVLRFVFPAFSSDSKTAWLIGSSPIKLTQLFLIKYVFYTLILIIISSLVSTVQFSVLPVQGDFRILITALVALSVPLLTGIGLALGALFPNFETDDAQVLSTSLPGLAFLLVSVVFGGVVAYTLYQVLKMHVSAVWFIFIFSLFFLKFLLLLRLVWQRLPHMEFIKVIR